MSATYAVGERRVSRGGTVWTIIREMPHTNGDPAYVRAVSEAGRERTFYCVEWAAMRRAPSHLEAG